MRACNDEMVKLELLMKINMCYDNVTIKDEGTIETKTTMVI